MVSRYLFKRFSDILIKLVGITLISFAVIHLAPGSPVASKSELNPKMSLQAKERLTQLYGLDKPLLTQYGHWLGHLAVFDFGTSFADGRKVTEKIAQSIPITILINGLSLLLILVMGIPAGVWGAVNQGKTGDKVLTVFLFAGFSIPTFWLALLLVSFFGVTLRVLPVSGISSVFYEDLGAAGKAMDVTRHLMLPVLVSSITGLASISSFVRNSMLDVLRQGYIRTARAKGLPERRVLYRHALKNALLPVVTILGLSLPGLLGGSVIFETVFSLPGMGRLFFNSVLSRDYPVIMGVLVLGAFLTLVGNFLADLGYRLVDPRIRLQ